jgi:nucleoside-diphosphate-sugar epimerase
MQTNMEDKMKVLVTGNNGGIGRWVVQRLLEAGHTIRTLDVLAQPQSSEYEHIPGDICDLTQVRRAVQDMQAIVHLAAVPYDINRLEAQLLDTNIHGTSNILLAAEEAGVERVVYFSSINALGQAEPAHPGIYLPLDDEIPHFNVHNYSMTKHICEEMCTAFARRGAFSVVSLRPTLVTHPGPLRYAWFRFTSEEMKMRSALGDFWSYVDVRDVAEATLLGLTAKVEGHQAFLLTADDNRAHIPSAELVEKYYPSLPWPKIPKEAYLQRGEFISLVDCRAAKQTLGWQPKYSMFDPDAGYED